MSITSANPDNLNSFVGAPVACRETFDGLLSNAVATQASVSAACVTHGVSGTYLSMGTTLVESMVANEEFVRAIRDALLDADRLDGVATVSDATVALRLASGDYATDAPPFEMPAVAMIGAPANSGYVDDPICAANGNFILVETDLRFPALSSALEVERWYNSLAADRLGVFGAGWSCVLDMCLDVDESAVTVSLHDGASIVFAALDEHSWNTTDRRRYTLERDDHGFVLRQHADRRRAWTFTTEGMLTGWSVDGSTVEVERADLLITRLRSQVSQRVLDIGYADGRLCSFTSSDGRSVRYEHTGTVLEGVRASWASLDYTTVVTDRGALLVSAVDADGVAEFVNEYDATGRVARQTSAFGRITSYDYGVPGTTMISDDDGVRQAMVHDARGNLTAIIDIDGSALRVTYDSLDRVVRIVDRLGNVTINEFDGTSDRLARRIDPDGLSESWSWDVHSRVAGYAGRNGSTLRFDYDRRANGRDWSTPVAVWRDGVLVMQTELNEVGLMVAHTDADGVQTFHGYDADGQVVRSTDGDGNSATSQHDERGQLIEWRDEIGVAIVMDHDDAGRLAAARLGEVEMTFGYTPAGRPSEGTLAGGLPWSVERGRHGAVTSFRDPVGAVVGYEHDHHGHVTATIAPDGAVYRQSFSPVGLPLAMIDPSGATWRVEYDRAGREVAQIDATGAVTSRTVDALGRTSSITAPDGAVAHYTYHPGGEVASVTLDDGRQWRTAVDLCGRVTAIVDPSGRRAERTYSPAGRLLTRTSPAGRIETFGYDRCGRIAVIDRDGRQEVHTHDARGLLIAIEDDRAGSQRFEWDAHRRLVSRQQGEQAPTRLGRNANGQITEVVDGSGAVTRFDFDSRGLLQSAIDPAGLVTTYEHDARGRLTQQIAPGGRATTWSFDVAGYPSTAVDPAGGTTMIERNAVGRITGVVRGSVGFERHLDACGREIGRSARDHTKLSSLTRDEQGRVVSAIGVVAELAVNFLWDDDDRLIASSMHGTTSAITRDDDGVPTGVVIDGLDDVRHIRNGHGTIVGALGSTVPPIVHDVGDAAGEQRDPAGRLLAAADGSIYRYDGAGRLVERTSPNRGTTQLTYDDTGLIATETSPLGRRQFAYDQAGRVSAIEVDGTVESRFTYDDAGRRSSVTNRDGTVTRFRWSDADHLIAIDVGRVDGTVDSTVIDVDGLGRPALVNGVPIGFDPISGRPNVIGERRLVHAGQLRWDSATQRWSTPQAGEADGLEIDGVRVFGHRVFDPQTHQFLTPDPLFSVPGTSGASSAYTFCWHDPVNFIDPSGLQPISVEDYDAIIDRERLGGAGAFVEAVKEDPWGYAALAVVVVAGAVMTAFPLTSAIGVGILVGVATSTAVTLASGQPFNPTLAAFNGLIGGVTMGYGAAAASTASSVATTTATSSTRALLTYAGINGGIGMAQSAGQQIIQNEGFDNFDVSDVFLAGGVSAVTTGVGAQLNPSSAGQAFVQGAGISMVGETASQVLDSQPGVSIQQIVGSGVSGGVESVVEFRASTTGAGSAGPDPDLGGAGGPGDPGPSAAAPPTVASINATNVTIEGADGTTVRLDHHVTMSDGSHAFVEVRAAGDVVGSDGSLPLTSNQATVIPEIRTTGGLPTGQNAAGVYTATGAGPTGPTTVHVVPHGTAVEVGSPIVLTP